jgi:putative ABC transport system substrate-binding protein
MRRREFIKVIAASAAAWPIAARAQQPARLPTVGFLGAGSPATAGMWISAFKSRLRELGWMEDRNITIDVRWAEGRQRPIGRDRGRPRAAPG